MKISVIIPVYNAQQFLEKAVQSALQFEEVFEILLIEDKSTDNSWEICEILKKKYERVKLFQHPDRENHGAGASRNLGLQKATGEYIAFLDSDDYYLTNRFETEKELFKNSKIEGVFGAIGTEFLTEKGKQEYQNKFSSELTSVNYPAEGKEVFEGLLGTSSKKFGPFFHLNGLTIRSSVIKKNNLKFNEDLRVHQDSDFILKLAFYSYLKSGNIEHPIAIRGVHNNNRITKIKAYSSEFYRKMTSLYYSRYKWSLSEENLSHNERKIIKLRYLAFKIGNKKGLSKMISLLYIVRYPELLKTRYRFHILNNWQ